VLLSSALRRVAVSVWVWWTYGIKIDSVSTDYLSCDENQATNARSYSGYDL
jgi:hypothetical protein